ncbi:sulfate adenylyltransferase subunit CysN [Methylocystis sp. ATCC 49242]|uniref:sulfate adenylyltransferase subunit CysN n=1 Tax=Methylocystis sp. ATCC 49242 TaxID=622637 RepID=UPI0001F885D8
MSDAIQMERLAGSGAMPARPTLRFLTCGSVDDGKSTLVGRLLYERQLIFDDQLAALEKDSKKHGTVGEDIDFALLVDGLEAEREQGITIDVAYRYFSTPARSFIVADSPGHEQYTRNMATGASNADLAILLVDARKGLLTQTRRHATIVSLLGVRHVVLAVNKMDLVGYDPVVFNKIVADFEQVAAALNYQSIAAIPMSARFGDNVISPSTNMPWYAGDCLLAYLETVDVESALGDQPMRMPVQWVNRPHLDFRGFAGSLASGRLNVGDEIVVAASGRSTRVARIVTMDGDRTSAEAPDSITVTFADEIDASRGDVLCHKQHRPDVVDQFAAHLIWMSDDKLLPGRSYLMKINGRTIASTVTEIKHKLDVDTGAKIAAKTLALNEIGFCNIASAASVAIDPYEANRTTGAFILIDRFTNATAAAGIVAFPLRRATNVHLQEQSVSKAVRSRVKHQKPTILWFTGLSGAGKSTVANLVETKLVERHAHTIMLDGDNIRHGLNKDLGFTDADRVENIRRIGEVAKLMVDAGLIVLCAFISPFKAERRMVRSLVEDGEFIEIFLDTPLEVCIARDPKGLYKRALAGEIKNFTGVDQVYERPEEPELHVNFTSQTPSDIADHIVRELVGRGIVHD